MTKALIVGMGIGNLYHSVFSSLGYEIDTVDSNPDKTATYTSIEQTEECYNIAVICTPNFTHESIARTIAAQCQIVLIEKPGVQNSEHWQNLVNDFPQTRFMMVKNNQYRPEIKDFKRLVDANTIIKVIWNNKNRIPNPGSWFTNRELAFGGVSRDLLPHMLSYYTCLTDYLDGHKLSNFSTQRHSLDEIDSTDYGVVNKDGVFNVDDFAELEYINDNKKWMLSANWKDNKADDVYISFSGKNSAVRHTLGLCPESAYKKMIAAAVENLNNDEFWSNQYKQDLWIHTQIEKL